MASSPRSAAPYALKKKYNEELMKRFDELFVTCRQKVQVKGSGEQLCLLDPEGAKQMKLTGNTIKKCPIGYLVEADTLWRGVYSPELEEGLSDYHRGYWFKERSMILRDYTPSEGPGLISLNHTLILCDMNVGLHITKMGFARAHGIVLTEDEALGGVGWYNVSSSYKIDPVK